jgi:hypothetical protein
MSKTVLTRTLSTVVTGALGAVPAAGVYTEATHAPNQS